MLLTEILLIMLLILKRGKTNVFKTKEGEKRMKVIRIKMSISLGKRLQAQRDKV